MANCLLTNQILSTIHWSTDKLTCSERQWKPTKKEEEVQVEEQEEEEGEDEEREEVTSEDKEEVDKVKATLATGLLSVCLNREGEAIRQNGIPHCQATSTTLHKLQYKTSF